MKIEKNKEQTVLLCVCIIFMINTFYIDIKNYNKIKQQRFKLFNSLKLQIFLSFSLIIFLCNLYNKNIQYEKSY